MVILMMPSGLVMQGGLWIGHWSSTAGVVVIVLCLAWLVYASFWATRAAHLMVFELRPFWRALGEGRVQVNAELFVGLCFLPVFGPWFSRFTRADREDDPQEKPGSFKEWESKRGGRG